MILSDLIRSFLNSSYQILSHAPLRRSSRTAASAAFGCGPLAIASSCPSDMVTVETPRRRLSAEVEGRWNSDSLSLYCVHVVSAPPLSSARLRQHEAHDPIAAQFCGKGGPWGSCSRKDYGHPSRPGPTSSKRTEPRCGFLRGLSQKTHGCSAGRGASGTYPLDRREADPQEHFSPEYRLV